jgi:hypothetical protein
MDGITEANESSTKGTAWTVVGEMACPKTLSKFEKTARWQNI